MIAAAMPLFVVERAFAEEIDLSSDDVRLLDEINADEGVHGLYSFLSADKRRGYCLYEAPSAEAILAVAKRTEIPAEAIVEVGAAAPELHARLGGWAAAQPGR
jgi:hypothetical protein